MLREAIVSGQLEPGHRLVEEEISRRMQVSRGPVREALRQLDQEGLVVSFPYRGTVVLGISEEEVQQVLIPLRLTLERFSVPRALDQMTASDFDELEQLVQDMEEAARLDDLHRVVETDVRFHEFLLTRSQQRHTVQVWRCISPRIRAYFYRHGRYKDLASIAQEHRQLLAALHTRDRHLLLDVLEQHIAVEQPRVDQAASSNSTKT